MSKPMNFMISKATAAAKPEPPAGNQGDRLENFQEKPVVEKSPLQMKIRSASSDTARVLQNKMDWIRARVFSSKLDRMNQITRMMVAMILVCTVVMLKR